MRFLYCVGVIGCAALLGLSASRATSYELIATSTEPDVSSGFTVNFTDTTNDGLFGPGDTINNFSGVTFVTTGDFFGFISQIPVGGPLNGSGFIWLFCSVASSTCDAPANGYGAQFGVFDYQLVQGAPVPAALPLLASGLGVFGFLARRRKQKNTAAALAD